MSYVELVLHGSVKEHRGPVMKLQNTFSPLSQDIMVGKVMEKPPDGMNITNLMQWLL